MSSFYEQKRDNTVLKALQKRGFLCTLKYQDKDSFNEVTGEVIDGNDAKVEVYGLFLDSMKKRQNPLESAKDTALVQPVKRIMITASGVPKAPATSDVLEIDKAEWVITEVAPLEPGNVAVFYELSLIQ